MSKEPNTADTASMPPPKVPRNYDQEAMSLVIPVGQSRWAIAAGYLGLVSLLFWPLGFVSIFASIKAISHQRTGATWLRIITGFLGGAVGVGVSLMFVYFHMFPE